MKVTEKERWFLQRTQKYFIEDHDGCRGTHGGHADTLDEAMKMKPHGYVLLTNLRRRETPCIFEHDEFYVHHPERLPEQIIGKIRFQLPDQHDERTLVTITYRAGERKQSKRKSLSLWR